MYGDVQDVVFRAWGLGSFFVKLFFSNADVQLKGSFRAGES